MSRAKEIEKIRDIIQQADDKYGDEQTWFFHQKMAEMFVDNGIGDKDRFEVNGVRNKNGGWHFGNMPIKPIDYEEE